MLENLDELLGKLDNCFTRLQDLDIKPTKHNMEIVLQTLYDMQEVYNGIKEGAENGRAAADTE